MAVREPPAAPIRQSRAIVRDLLAIVAVGAGAWLVHRLGRIVLVLILALFFAYLIAPLVDRVQRPVVIRGRSRRLPKGIAVAVVYALIAIGVAAGTAFLWPRATEQLHAAVVNGPAYAESFHAWERGWTKYYERLRIPPELRRGIDQSVLGAGDAGVAYLRGSLMTLLGLLTDIPWLCLVPILAFLLLKDAATLRRSILTALPHAVQLRGHRLFEELNETFAAFIRAQLIASAVVGLLCGAGFALLGNPYAVLLGVVAGVLEIVPLAGPLVVAAIAIGSAALFSPTFAVWTGVFLALLRLLQDYVIYPRLIGRDIHLHPLVVILAVLVGAELGGVAGIFMAIPSVALLTVLGRHFIDWRGRDAAAALPVPSRQYDHGRNIRFGWIY
jgi:predicted PurR-regulated permease PerM